MGKLLIILVLIAVGAAFAIGRFTTLFGLLIGVITAVIRAVSDASD